LLRKKTFLISVEKRKKGFFVFIKYGKKKKHAGNYHALLHGLQEKELHNEEEQEDHA
jgi:hypothetical protein